METTGTLLEIGLVTYLVGAPVVHFAHKHVAIGFLSMGLRVALPLAGAGIAVATCSDHGEFGCLGPALLGITAGLATPVILDAAVFSYEKPPPDAEAVRHALPIQLGLSLHPKHPAVVIGMSF